MPEALVDLATQSANLALLRGLLSPGTDILAAVKADAYGHGAPAVARRLAQDGVRWFGVATAAEALELRRGGVTGDILIFGPVYRGVDELIEHDVTLSLCGPEGLEAIRNGSARRAARVHLKLDTGMGRLGLRDDGALALARAADRDRRVRLEGVWTHLARADEEDAAHTERQLLRFQRFLDALAREGIEPGVRHAANSAALITAPASHFDLVRPGIALHGYHSSPVVAERAPPLRPTLTLSAPVTFVKRVAEGEPVSYGGLWTAPRATTVATVRIGYADGYPRGLTNRGWARHLGRRVEVAGRVCMDQLLLDVGDLEVAVGDRITLLGPGSNPASGPDAETLAALAGTISYELLTGLSPRVTRRYRG